MQNEKFIQDLNEISCLFLKTSYGHQIHKNSKIPKKIYLPPEHRNCSMSTIFLLYDKNGVLLYAVIADKGLIHNFYHIDGDVFVPQNPEVKLVKQNINPINLKLAKNTILPGS